MRTTLIGFLSYFPQCNVTGLSSLSLIKVGRKIPWLYTYIGVCTLDAFIFFLSYWELPIDEDNMCDEVSLISWKSWLERSQVCDYDASRCIFQSLFICISACLLQGNLLRQKYPKLLTGTAQGHHQQVPVSQIVAGVQHLVLSFLKRRLLPPGPVLSPCISS